MSAASLLRPLGGFRGWWRIPILGGGRRANLLREASGWYAFMREWGRLAFAEAVALAAEYRATACLTVQERYVADYWNIRVSDRERVLEAWMAEARFDADTYGGLIGVVASILRRNEPLPESLELWAAGPGKRTKGGCNGPKRRRGPRRERVRDEAIVDAIYALGEFGLKPTRNAVSRPESAGDAVAQAFGLSYQVVEKAWGRWRRDLRAVGGRSRADDVGAENRSDGRRSAGRSAGFVGTITGQPSSPVDASAGCCA